ncbi:hypothetical protein ACVWWI_003347 [Bradyrhizobium sp. USDA 3686]|uniref:hypothetical protein n=1 Tax=Bradyrhizobium canariense TaxID=255045 RepID=UPI001958D36C|nr:hypothetical protein [Bradyrhizobium canariense]MBM7483337.1 hypothetical protein [Bradyrhizobium canariense]
MGVDIEAYRSVMGAALKSQGYACIFVVTTTDGNPCRLNYATDLLGAVKRLRRTSPAQLIIQDVVWLPDRSMAMLVAEHVRDDLERHQAAGGWLSLPASQVAEAVRNATERQHPGVITFAHAQLMERWAHASSQPAQERGSRRRTRSRPGKRARMAAAAP